MSTPHRSGFVGIVGRPNVGKSTILNAYLGEKLAIVTPRPQTTRHRILGVLTRPDAQIMFLDSPGLHEAQHVLGRYMLEVAKAVLEEADVLVVVIDATRGITKDDERVFAQLKRVLRDNQRSPGPRTALLAINKVDLVKKPKLLPLLEACAQGGVFADAMPVAALRGEQVTVLRERIIAALPEGPQW